MSEAVQECACGGVIAVCDPTPARVEEAVRSHQRTLRHARWRKDGGLLSSARPVRVARPPVLWLEVDPYERRATA